MAFCIKCGSENPAEAGFCHNCGQPIFKQDTKPAVAPQPPVIATRNMAKNSGKRPLTLLIIINLFLYCSIDVALIFIIPVFGAMFADFGAKLPALTQLLMDFSNFFKRWWWCLNPLLAAVVVALAIYSTKRVAPRKLLRVAAILQFLLLLAIVVSMFLPIFQLGAVAGGLK